MMTSNNCQIALGNVKNVISLVNNACKIGFKEIGTSINESLEKLGEVDAMMKELKCLIKDQNDRIARKDEKEKIEALVKEVRGQILFKKIPTILRDTAHDKLHIGHVQEYEWLTKSADGKYQTLWIRNNCTNLMKKAIKMKIDWANEYPSNSQERRLISNIMIEEAVPRVYRSFLMKLRADLVNQREDGKPSTTFIQKVEYDSAMGTLAVIYQHKTNNTAGFKVLGYVANQALKKQEFQDVPWYDTNTGELHGRVGEGPSAAALGADRRQARKRTDYKPKQVATGANKQPYRKEKDHYKFTAIRNYLLEVGCHDGEILDQVDLKHSELTTLFGIQYADDTLGEYINFLPWSFIIKSKILMNDYYKMKEEHSVFHMDDPAAIFEEEMDLSSPKNAKRKALDNPETPTKPNKPSKTTAPLAIVNREPTPIKPPFAATVEIDPKSDFNQIKGITQLNEIVEDVNADIPKNVNSGVAAPHEPLVSIKEPDKLPNKDNTTLSMEAAFALFHKVTAAKDKFKR